MAATYIARSTMSSRLLFEAEEEEEVVDEEDLAPRAWLPALLRTLAAAAAAYPRRDPVSPARRKAMYTFIMGLPLLVPCAAWAAWMRALIDGPLPPQAFLRDRAAVQHWVFRFERACRRHARDEVFGRRPGEDIESDAGGGASEPGFAVWHARFYGEAAAAATAPARAPSSGLWWWDAADLAADQRAHGWGARLAEATGIGGGGGVGTTGHEMARYALGLVGLAVLAAAARDHWRRRALGVL